MKIYKYPKGKNLSLLLTRPLMDTGLLEEKVAKILREVKSKGDSALKKFSLQFDQVKLKTLQVSDAEIQNAILQISPDLKNAIKLAAKNIKTFHASQSEKYKKVETTSGVSCWRKAVGIEKVGLYIPGGTAPLFSTVLMLGIPAALAKCKEVILCTPCDKNGKINPAILYAASLVGIKKIYKVGGAQAIAAMAYGTESIEQVYKIFGPGNQYVTCAKQLVCKEGMAIDMPAGPSELAILADSSCEPAFVAADLLSQAEHGADSQVILISQEEKVINKVKQMVLTQLEELPRKIIAKKALENSKFILVKNLKEGIDVVNAYAPEHLIIACKKAEAIGEKITNAGSVFLGNFTPESAGDYASGTNHTLPTNAHARAYSGVSLDSFLKKITFQKITEKGLNKIGLAIEIMAATEQLDAHKNAVSIRLKKK
ncbi:MAG: histidinol dehydrogenase [Sphingobacteriaceae bacterium]|nr:histidinol dehydrogenase [Sphingobacteriaceae bacterium]